MERTLAASSEIPQKMYSVSNPGCPCLLLSLLSQGAVADHQEMNPIQAGRRIDQNRESLVADKPADESDHGYIAELSAAFGHERSSFFVADIVGVGVDSMRNCDERSGAYGKIIGRGSVFQRIDDYTRKHRQIEPTVDLALARV